MSSFKSYTLKDVSRDLTLRHWGKLVDVGARVAGSFARKGADLSAVRFLAKDSMNGIISGSAAPAFEIIRIGDNVIDSSLLAAQFVAAHEAVHSIIYWGMFGRPMLAFPNVRASLVRSLGSWLSGKELPFPGISLEEIKGSAARLGVRYVEDVLRIGIEEICSDYFTSLLGTHEAGGYMPLVLDASGRPYTFRSGAESFDYHCLLGLDLAQWLWLTQSGALSAKGLSVEREEAVANTVSAGLLGIDLRRAVEWFRQDQAKVECSLALFSKHSASIDRMASSIIHLRGLELERYLLSLWPGA